MALCAGPRESVAFRSWKLWYIIWAVDGRLLSRRRGCFATLRADNDGRAPQRKRAGQHGADEERKADRRTGRATHGQPRERGVGQSGPWMSLTRWVEWVEAK